MPARLELEHLEEVSGLFDQFVVLPILEIATLIGDGDPVGEATLAVGA
ncbi:hypothetical protein AB0L74_32650 [Streptomyces sp. NPDC052020]